METANIYKGFVHSLEVDTFLFCKMESGKTLSQKKRKKVSVNRVTSRDISAVSALDVAAT